MGIEEARRGGNLEFETGAFSSRRDEGDFAPDFTGENPTDALTSLGININNFNPEDYFDEDGIIIIPSQISADNRQKFISAIEKLKIQSYLSKKSLEMG